MINSNRVGRERELEKQPSKRGGGMASQKVALSQNLRVSSAEGSRIHTESAEVEVRSPAHKRERCALWAAEKILKWHVKS